MTGSAYVMLMVFHEVAAEVASAEEEIRTAARAARRAIAAGGGEPQTAQPRVANTIGQSKDASS